MKKTKTLVIGVSEKLNRYSNKAVRMLSEYKHEVIAFGRRPGEIQLEDGTLITIIDSKDSHKDVDTVTMYINPTHQIAVEEYIMSLKPRRVIFNPGTENRPFAKKLEAIGIQTLEACTLVMLRTGQYD